MQPLSIINLICLLIVCVESFINMFIASFGEYYVPKIGNGRLLYDKNLVNNMGLLDGDLEARSMGTEWWSHVYRSLFITRDTVYLILTVISEGMTCVERQLPHSVRSVMYFFKPVCLTFCGLDLDGIIVIYVFIKSIVVVKFFVVLTKLIEAINFLLNIGWVFIALLEGHRIIYYC